MVTEQQLQVPLRLATQPCGRSMQWDYNEAFGQCCGYPIEGWQHGGVSRPGEARQCLRRPASLN